MQKVETQQSPIYDARCVNETYTGVRVEDLERFRSQAIRFVSSEDPTEEDLERIRTGLTKTEEHETIIFKGQLANGVEVFRSVSLKLGIITEVFKGKDNRYVLQANNLIGNLTVNVRRGPNFPDQPSL